MDRPGQGERGDLSVGRTGGRGARRGENGCDDDDCDSASIAIDW
jgi:hypothetical protein